MPPIQVTGKLGRPPVSWHSGEAHLPTDLQNTTLGQYQIIERVGAGGMGTVYRGYQPSLDRAVAIKVLPQSDARDASFYERFRLEARAIARLDHPNILPIFDFGEHEGMLYIVMPLVTGGTLKDQMQSWMPLHRALQLCEPVADALDYAHSQGIIHRDVKPANVLVSQNDRPLLADFGLAKLMEDAPALTGTGIGIGTPYYMSPEQCTAQGVDAQTDQYALAVMVFEMLSGQLPYSGGTGVEILLKHVSAPVPHVRELNPLVSNEVDGALARALAKRPEDRYSSCRDFMDALRFAQSNAPAGNGAAIGAGPASPPAVGMSWGAATVPHVASNQAAGVGLEARATMTTATPVDFQPVGHAAPAPRSAPAWRRVAAAVRPTPRRSMLAIVLILLGLGAPAVGTLRQPAPQPMSGIVNFAVAEFGQINESGAVVKWENGPRLSQSLYQQLERELNDIRALTGRFQLRHEGVGLITGSSSAARTETAGRTADQLRAQLVIYGNLERRGTQTMFSPEFYVSGLRGAEELVGPNRLGTPVVSEGREDSLGYALVLSDALKARSEALTLFTVGLTYHVMGQPGSAVEFFERARGVQPWADSDGKEVVYLFLGTAYKERNGEGDLERARDAYLTAAQLNPQYARAYIGLGNLYYEEFNRSDMSDLSLIDRAIAEYDRASAATVKPETAYVDAKVHVNLGNAYVVKAQAGEPALFTRAQTEYTQVVADYERGRNDIQQFAAQAYLGLGLIYDLAAGDTANAAESYRRAINAATSNKEVEQMAQARLANLEGGRR